MSATSHVWVQTASRNQRSWVTTRIEPRRAARWRASQSTPSTSRWLVGSSSSSSSGWPSSVLASAIRRRSPPRQRRDRRVQALAGSARSRRRRAARRARCGRRRRPSTRGRRGRRRAPRGSVAGGSRSSPWPSIATCSPPERVTAPESGSSSAARSAAAASTCRRRCGRRSRSGRRPRSPSVTSCQHRARGVALGGVLEVDEIARGEVIGGMQPTIIGWRSSTRNSNTSTRPAPRTTCVRRADRGASRRRAATTSPTRRSSRCGASASACTPRRAGRCTSGASTGRTARRCTSAATRSDAGQRPARRSTGARRPPSRSTPPPPPTRAASAGGAGSTSRTARVLGFVDEPLQTGERRPPHRGDRRGHHAPARRRDAPDHLDDHAGAVRADQPRGRRRARHPGRPRHRQDRGRPAPRRVAALRRPAARARGRARRRARTETFIALHRAGAAVARRAERRAAPDRLAGLAAARRDRRDARAGDAEGQRRGWPSCWSGCCGAGRASRAATIPFGSRASTVEPSPADDLPELIAAVRERTLTYEAGPRALPRAARRAARRRAVLDARSLRRAGGRRLTRRPQDARSTSSSRRPGWPRTTPEALVEQLFKNRAPADRGGRRPARPTRRSPCC